MEPEKILHDMALYDFKAPINVLFYDENSDDEIKSENSVVTENNATSTHSNILMKSNIKEEKDEESLDSVIVVPSSSEKSDLKDKHFKECVENNYTKVPNPSKIGERKRKSNDLFCENEGTKQKINSNVPNKTSEIPQDKNKSSDHAYPTLLQDNDCIMENPLLALSHFLIVIGESYNYHISISTKKPTKNKDISKKHYLEIKYHFFKTAYKIVDEYILPKENDRIFVYEFLSNTIKIANQKTKHDYSKIIKTLYKDLIKWVKQKKSKETKPNGKNNTLAEKPQPNCKEPNYILIEPAVQNFENTATAHQQHYNITNNAITDTKPKNMNNFKPTCTFTPDLPGEEISINFNPALENNQNNQTMIDNEISCEENIASQTPVSSSQLFQYLQNCNITRTLKSLSDIRTNAISLVNHNDVQSNVNEITHNETMANIQQQSRKQNDNTTIINDIYHDENIRSKNPLLSRYLRDCNNRPFTNDLANTDNHTDAISFLNHNNVQPNAIEMAHNQTKNIIKRNSSKQNDKTKMVRDIPRDENIRTEDALPASQLFNCLQNCNGNRVSINRLSSTDISPDTISFDHNKVQHNSNERNEMSRTQNMSNSNYQQIHCNSSIPSRHYGNANNTAFSHRDPNQKRNIDLNIVNSTPYPMHVFAPQNTNIEPNQCLNILHQSHNLNNSQTNINNPSNTVSLVPFVTHSQTTSSTCQQALSNRTSIIHPPSYHKGTTAPSKPPHCFQNTAGYQIDPNQKRIYDNNSNPTHNIQRSQYHTMNIGPNQVLNSHCTNPANRICDNNRMIFNNVGPAPPVYNTAPNLHAHYRNCQLTNVVNRNSVSLPQHLPSNANRSTNSTVVDQSNINLPESRVLNTVQNQELRMQPPPSYSVRQDKTPLAQDYASPAIQHNMVPEPHHSRSSVSTDSGFASPACDDGSNNMEVIMNSLFELEEITSQTSDLMAESTTSLPVITHVTSLSSKVAYIKNGPCHLCGKIAKEMCSGCYKLYYCSPNCQISDWRLHKYNCAQNNIN